MKYAKYTQGQIEALFNIVGGEEAVDAVLRGEKDVVLTDAILKFFDKNGRRIPLPILQYSHCDPDRSFGLKQPKLDYLTRLVRMAEAFNITPDIQAVDFEAQAKALIAELQASEFLRPLLKGVYYPLYIPKLTIADYGETIENILLVAAERAYQKEFSGRPFTNYRKSMLKGEVTTISGMRHERIVERAKQGSQVVIYFPNPLQGFSVLAQREQETSLPEHLSIAGPLETLTGAATYTDSMMPHFHTPGYDMSAVQWRQPERSLYLWANDGGAKFDFRGVLGIAFVKYSGGLVFSR
ncbi:MAG: hypothetical protein HY974_03375 [Candidatus Kerfeldbacteria bacterium]|nr:hypothetical protein [Candidatus Kerfeldbacteria bacterium]